MSEGFFIIDEINFTLLEGEERGTVLILQDDLLYLFVSNSTQEGSFPESIRIIDVQQPENPDVVGKYDLDEDYWVVDFKIKDNIAYILKRIYFSGGINWTITLLNITNPSNPIELGVSAVETATSYIVGLDSWCLASHENYTYVNTDFELIIFNTSNPTLPEKVANYTSSGGELHINNDYLYLVSSGVKIYSLAEPINPLFLGEINTTKNIVAKSDLYGNYIINAFWYYGIQIYNCTDPYHPTICWDFDFPDREFFPEGTIHDVEIIGDKLFTGANRLNVFDLSDLQKVKRITRLRIGDKYIDRLVVSEDYIYITAWGKFKIYSYKENKLLRNLGIGISVGVSVVIVASLLIRKKIIQKKSLRYTKTN
ncbi:MAG: LVIVD repeat-containing protein [Candidatus Heimdallarchaeota archaeon]